MIGSELTPTKEQVEALRDQVRAGTDRCCVSGHSGPQALQLQHPESRGHFRGVRPSLKPLPIRSK
jgi:hypothetical protein